MVNGREATVTDGVGETQLTWTTEDNTSYWLWGDLETEELRRVAQAVAPYSDPMTDPA